MCLVGYKDDPEWPGGGYFILRNSWGKAWGSQCPYGAGYGVIPYKFISLYCWEAWTAVVEPRGRRSTEGARASGQRAEAPPRPAQAAGHKKRLRSRVRGKRSGRILECVLAVLFLGMVAGIGLQAAKPWDGRWAVTNKVAGFLLRVDPGTIRHYLAAGEHAMQEERYADALQAYTAALAIQPRSVDVLSRKALAHAAANDPAGGLRCLDEAVRLDEGLAGIHYRRGLVLLEMGRGEEAVEAWRRVIEIDPGDRSARGLVERYAP